MRAASCLKQRWGAASRLQGCGDPSRGRATRLRCSESTRYSESASELKGLNSFPTECGCCLRLRVASGRRAPGGGLTKDCHDGHDSASTRAAERGCVSHPGGGLTKDYHDGHDSATTSAAAALDSVSHPGGGLQCSGFSRIILGSGLVSVSLGLVGVP